MDAYIDSLGEARVFSTSHASCGYWKIEIAEWDREKTAVTSHHGLYQFERMPFGLKNEHATFQWEMYVILSSVRWQSALFYLDDTVVFPKTVEQNLNYLHRVLTLLQDTSKTRKLKMWSFFAETVIYLRHVIHHGKLEIAKSTIDAIRQPQDAAIQTEIRSVLGLCIVFRRFSPNSCAMSHLLARRFARTNQSPLRR